MHFEHIKILTKILQSFLKMNNASPVTKMNANSEYPIFECILIHGRKHFNKESKPKLLYKFPPNYEDDPTDVVFSFPYDDHFNKNDWLFLYDTYSSGQTPIYYDSLVNYASNSEIHSYIFRFVCSPISRPIFYEDSNFDDECYMTDIYQSDEESTTPTCLYTITIKTKHPFSHLYFEFCKSIICAEFCERLNCNEIEQLIFREKKKQINTFNTILYMKLENNTIKSSLKKGFDAREKMIISIFNNKIVEYIENLFDDKHYNLQLCSSGIEPLFEFIELNDLIKLLTCIFLEKIILVLGQNEEIVSRVVTSLSKIISPFSFQFPIYSIVPESNSHLLESPWAFIAGVKKTDIFINKINDVDRKDTVIIDLDEKTILWPELQHPTIAGIETYEECLLPIFNQIKNKKQNGNWKKFFKFFNRNNKKNEDIDIKSYILNVISCIFNVNNMIFVEKINPSIVTKVSLIEEKKSLFQNEKKIECDSEMIKDNYITLFDEKDKPFISEFIKTGLFDVFTGISCLLKTERERKNYSFPEKSICCIC